MFSYWVRPPGAPKLKLKIEAHAIRGYRKFCEQPLTLRGSDYAHAVQELNKAIDQAEGFLK
jgi:hypothetical protein